MYAPCMVREAFSRHQEVVALFLGESGNVGGRGVISTGQSKIRQGSTRGVVVMGGDDVV